MASAVESTALNDDESTSNILKRRRSSSINPNEIDIEQTPSKRVRSSSITNNSTSDNNHISTVYSSVNDLVQSHRNLIREYIDLQFSNHSNLSNDEQHFIQSDEDLLEKIEKNIHDINHIPSTPPSRNGKRQRYQSINSTNQSFDRIKHETHILKRIDELKSDGKWTNQRLAKCLEPNKRKTHWDYLLDEMRWLAEDFLLEKRWKQAMAKKLSLAVLKYFRDKTEQHNQIKYLRKQAQFISNEVMNFWKNIHKLIEYKEKNYLISSDIDDEETIEYEEQFEKDEYDLNELKELENDQNQSIETVLKQHYGIDLKNENKSFKESIETNEQLENLLTKIQSYKPIGITLNTTSVQTPVPFLLKYPLRDYQHIGFDWLVKFSEENFHCILADEIGLGKTIQTIALLAYLACEKNNWGPHLIILEKKYLSNWERELIKWCPSLKIFIYDYSIDNYENLLDINDYHICIVSNENFFKNIHLFSQITWKYIILDEIDNLKNFNIYSEHRLLLTNKLIKNSLIIFQFLMSNFDLSNWLLKQQDKNYFEDILQSFILRRLRIDVKEQLPKIYQHIFQCNLSKRQNDLYKKSNNILQLKKICNHPDLIEIRKINSPLILEKQLIKYKIPKLIYNMNFKNPYLGFNSTTDNTFFCFHIQFNLQPTKQMFRNQINKKNFIIQEKFQLTKDIIEKYRNSSIWYQTDMNTTEENFSNEIIDEDIELLYEINSERCKYRPLYGYDILSQIKLALEPCNYLNRTTFSGYSLCQYKITNILKKLIKTNENRFNDYKNILNRFIFCTKRVIATSIDLYQLNEIKINSKPLIEVLSSIDFDILSSINHIKQNMLLEYPEREYIKYDCGKLQILSNILLNLKFNKHRCIIYTEMFNMLNILERFLNIYNYKYLRLDNRQSIDEINNLIEYFNNEKKIFLIISTIYIEINLTGADTIIFYDKNFKENQCDYIRQIQDVNIYYLISKNTIEEKDFNQLTDRNYQETLTLEEEEEDIDEESDEEELNLFDQQLRPIERYALRCMETYRNEYPINQFNSNTYFDSEQFRKDWQSSRLKALKEQEEKEYEQDNDDMLYTYTRDNEQKVKYNYKYSSTNHSLVASNLVLSKKNFINKNSTFFSKSLSSPVSLSIPLHSPPLSPLLSSKFIKRSSRNTNTYSSNSNEYRPRRYLHFVSSPSPSPPPPPLSSSDHIDNSPVLLDFDGNLKRKSKKITTKQDVSKRSSTMNTDSGVQQQIRIVDSLESLNLLTKRSVITFIYNNSIIKLPSETNNRLGQILDSSLSLTKTNQQNELIDKKSSGEKKKWSKERLLSVHYPR